MIERVPKGVRVFDLLISTEVWLSVYCERGGNSNRHDNSMKLKGDWFRPVGEHVNFYSEYDDAFGIEICELNEKGVNRSVPFAG